MPTERVVRLGSGRRDDGTQKELLAGDLRAAATRIIADTVGPDAKKTVVLGMLFALGLRFAVVMNLKTTATRRNAYTATALRGELKAFGSAVDAGIDYVLIWKETDDVAFPAAHLRLGRFRELLHEKGPTIYKLLERMVTLRQYGPEHRGAPRRAGA